MASFRICSIPDCDKPEYELGYCNTHYQKWKRHGDPLSNQPAPTPRGVVQHFFRETVLTYEGDDCLVWPFSRRQNGYGQVYWNGRIHYVHRLACELVHGKPQSPRLEASHSCGMGASGCCNPMHLRWDTRDGNQADRRIHGTHNDGENHPMAKITKKQAREILALRGKLTLSEIAREYGLSKQHISDIHTRKRWKDI